MAKKGNISLKYKSLGVWKIYHYFAVNHGSSFFTKSFYQNTKQEGHFCRILYLEFSCLWFSQKKSDFGDFPVGILELALLGTNTKILEESGECAQSEQYKLQNDFKVDMTDWFIEEMHRIPCAISYGTINTIMLFSFYVLISNSYLCTAKNTVISPKFLVWKFCGKAQFPHSFRRITRNYAETMLFHKISTTEN